VIFIRLPSIVVSEYQGAQKHYALVLSSLAPASIADSVKDAIFQAASNTLKTVAVRRRKWILR
jgi:hypothetical protein